MSDSYITIIHVPYAEKDEAKALGAKWHRDMRTWFVPSGVDLAPFSKWTERLVDDGIAGAGGLYVDLVPKTAWFSNLRSELSEDEWNAVRKQVYSNSGSVCSICSGRGPKHPVEAHERWIFDIETRTQTLLRIEALCPACHEATHMGLANVKGNGERAAKRLMYVNGWTPEQVDSHVANAFMTWEYLSRIDDWKLDASALLAYSGLTEETLRRIDELKSHPSARKAIKAWQEELRGS